jgi:hypothetical protein
MSTIVCYQPESAEGDRPVWRRITGPRFLSERQGILVLELPKRGRYRAFVNGLDVLGGLQVVRRGDLVRVIDPGGTEFSYVVGRVLPSAQPGAGRPCQFTGKPIHDEAVECSSCGALFAQVVSEQLGSCPACGEPLGDQDEVPPEEELW